MADESSKNTKTTSWVIGPRKDLNGDWSLVDLMGFANLGVSIGVTLTVGGLVVSGQLMSAKAYLQETASMMASANMHGDNEILETFETAWKSFADMEEASIGDDDALGMNAEFIHLSNARLGGPSGWFPNPGTLWRGRVDRVDSWILGTISE